ncbi:hypothetical protein B1A99_04635 [Cohnella sp. CIP 111063]|uniref:extracellular solute-binding protein n=1 Tax=unclassified Cohnella TaxID=2636738 RepID=UPI000B8BB76F|nr:MULTISPECIES: extracellular solute-binding protein [unclassified Cohnella]OXS61890.1 hypothetical protein B1A99_04635 [Cohnella sp. CIP 111063]PRX74345.1 putative aldouronate transport system substrate-binding protein [Cohnella sp. SGD-V74]
MKKNKRGLISMLCMIIVAGTVMAGCSSSGNKGTAESSATSQPQVSAAASDEGESAARLDMKFWTRGLPVENAFTKKYAENRFNVNIEHLVMDDNYKEKVNLMIVSGDFPDYIKDMSFAEYDQYVQQGVLAEIPIELLEQHAPKYMAWLKEVMGSDDPFRYFQRDGKNYAMPNMWTPAVSVNALGMREDWLEKVGIAKKPETLAEFEEALIKFRNDDPDNNGKKDTYGVSAALGSANDIQGLFSYVFAAFGVHPGLFYEKDGSIKRGEIEPAAKDALAVLRRWYEAGLIDPEFVINKGDNLDQKVFESKVGMLQSAWWNFIPPEAFFEGKYVDKMPDAKWLVLNGPQGPNGDAGLTQGNPMTNSGVLFLKHMEQDREKMIRYIEMIEAFNFEPEYLELANYGEEGVTFRKNGEAYEWIPPYDKKEEQQKFGIDRSIYHYDGIFNNYDLQAPFMTAPQYREIRREAEQTGKGKYDILYPVHKPVYNDYFDRLDQFTVKSFINFISGRSSLDDFDKYVAEWNAMGGDKVMEEARQLYAGLQ